MRELMADCGSSRDWERVMERLRPAPPPPSIETSSIERLPSSAAGEKAARAFRRWDTHKERSKTNKTNRANKSVSETEAFLRTH